MRTDTGSTASLWMTEQATPNLSAPLQNDEQTDVCVIGAGIAGLTTAYHLGRQGKKVIVLESDRTGGGETGRTTAHLANALDDRYFRLERVHGRKGIRIVCGPGPVASVLEGEGIPVTFSSE